MRDRRSGAAGPVGNTERLQCHFDRRQRAKHHSGVAVAHVGDSEGLAGQIADAMPKCNAANVFRKTADGLGLIVGDQNRGHRGCALPSMLDVEGQDSPFGPSGDRGMGRPCQQGMAMPHGFETFLEDHVDAARGIAAIAIQRGGLTALTLMTLVLERNKFNDPLDTEAGLAGVTFMIVTAAVGFVCGAIIAPFGVSKVGRHRWMQLAMGASALSVIALALTRTSLTLALTAFFTALCGQSVKVTNDALVQSKIDDIFRGRVFAVYDVVVNFAIVFGALLAAVLLPSNGDTWTLPTVVGIGYLATSLII